MNKITHQIHPRQLKQPIPVFVSARIGCFGCRRQATQHSTFNVRQSAFTLLEVILAVTIAGALLAAAAALMVSVTNVWMERQDRHFFEDHVDGVTEFLQACFSNAGSEIALGDSEDSGDGTSGGQDESGEGMDPNTQNPDATDPGDVTVGISTPDNGSGSTSSGNENSGGAGLVRVSEDPIGWSKPPGYADYQDPLLHFGLTDTPPLLIQTGDAPVIGIEAFLHFERDEGLSLLWYTPLQEESEDLNDLRRTPISDLISQVEYIYWDQDFEKWETETEPKEGEGDEQFLLPRFLKLTFEYQGETKERTLTIPVPSQSALIF